MRLRRAWFVFALLLSVASANPAFDAWAERFTIEWIRANPMAATATQYLPASEQDAADRALILTGPDLIPLEPRLAAALVARARRGLEELKGFPESGLTPTQRASAAFLRWTLETTLAATAVSDHRFLFEQFSGVQVMLVNALTQIHPIRNARDVDNYLARLERVGPLLDEAITLARERGERGLLPPRFILVRTLEGLDRFLAAEPAANVFVDSLAQRTARLPDKSAEARQAALTRAEQIVSRITRPAYQRLHALLVAQRDRASDDAGVWRLPRGAEYYAAALRLFTTTELSADEIHTIGQREVARIEREMDGLLRQLGYTDGSVQARYLQLQATLLPATNPDPRPQLVEEITRIVRDAEQRAAGLFDLRPKAPVEVRREPAFTEASAAARYTSPAPDGSRPGIYWIPLARLTPDVIWLGAGTRSVAYHEAVPGHHFQLALQQESTELPRFRKLGAYGFISAFGEGWALYAERIADEAGWYEGDVPGRLGYLSFQLLRAKRLVVDTGLHAKKWTRQQAIDYGIQASEVERYVVWPGQACSYMIGQLRILELRQKAQQALGDRFTLREFHSVVLRTGNVPLDVLAGVVDAWIASKR